METPLSLPQHPADIADVVINDNAAIVLAKRYQRKDGNGEVRETPTDLFWRVAYAIASEEAKYETSPYTVDKLAREFYALMTSYRFLPNSPTLMNAGTRLGQLAACFVLPVGDSIEEIFDAVKYAAMIHKSGGGTGFSFSRLRPANARVGSTGGIASGPLSFLKIFNCATEQIKQGGTRRGANMGILRVDHPDIIEFIRAKEKEGEFNNFNLSVGLTEAFMEAVEQNEDYAVVAPQTGEVVEMRSARKVFDLLVSRAWRSGDPGIVFLDRINRENPTPDQGEIESTNPCGEQPLLPYEACNLGSLNLALFHDAASADGVDWETLRETIHLSVRFLDNVIDASRYPLPQIDETVRRNRKIGLGVMGFADLLFQLKVAYDSPEGRRWAERLMGFVRDESRNASRKLAEERGPFPAFETSIFKDDPAGPIRNATTTTIAPTGTLSIIGGCSSGVEPLFALSFARNVMDGETLLEVNPYFEEALKEAGLSAQTRREVMAEVARTGSVQFLEAVPKDVKRVFVTAMDIDPEAHLRMQAAFQAYTDNAVSKTVNLPNAATEEQIRRIYTLAYQLGCKGVTVYRDGSKAGQVLCTGESGQQEAGEGQGQSRVRHRPDVVQGFTHKVQTGLGTLYVTVNEVDGEPFELFATIGKSGRSVTAKAEAIGRLVSLGLRSGIAVADIVEQLKGIGGEHPIFQKKGLLLSLPDAIAWILEHRYLTPKGVKVTAATGASSLSGQPVCPDCGGELTFQEGCFACHGCGYTKCG